MNHIFRKGLTELKILALIVLINGCRETKLPSSYFQLLTRDTFTTQYEKNYNDTSKIIRLERDSTSFYFLKGFNDTVILYVNYRKVFKAYINNSSFADKMRDKNK